MRPRISRSTIAARSRNFSTKDVVATSLKPTRCVTLYDTNLYGISQLRGNFAKALLWQLYGTPSIRLDDATKSKQFYSALKASLRQYNKKARENSQALHAA